MSRLHRAALLGLLLLAPATAQRLYVDAAVVAPGNGLSWATAFRTLQGALAVAASGSEIWMATGVYSGGFTVPAGVTVLGGFRNDYLRLTQRSPFANRVTLDGGATQRVLSLGAGSVVDGVHVQNGRTGAPGGGGVLIDGVNATLRTCVLRFNLTTGAAPGAALLVRGGAQATIENCLFYTNGDATSGDTIEVIAAGGTYRNLTCYDSFGNALSFRQGSTPRITNCIFSQNLARGIYQVGSNDTPILENCLFFANPVANYRFVASELTTAAQINALPFATSNVVGDPRFVSIGANDFHLQATSAAIDQGRDVAGAAPRDLFGAWRALDGNLDGVQRPDIGAAEFTNVTLTLVSHSGHAHIHPQVDGTAGLGALLMISAGTIPPVSVNPFGMFALDPTLFLLLPIGSIPQVLTIDIPPEIPVGTVLYWQAFGYGGLGGGNLSNLADLQVQI